ncbi:hypothetical protein [Thermodesulfovibrio sp. 3462-1]|uniref:Uncharacterized protein n=1 Tax=Thermodesulfovibrio obliviosus TaxID=3118332 RepID=A0AAU8H3K9_9BACT
MIFDSIPVLMYYHVMPCNSVLNVTPEIFEEQLRGLKTKGWKTLDAKEFLYLMENPEKPRKNVFLSPLMMALWITIFTPIQFSKNTK